MHPDPDQAQTSASTRLLANAPHCRKTVACSQPGPQCGTQRNALMAMPKPTSASTKAGWVVPTLSHHGLPWRHALASASLAALWSAVSPGPGLAERTPLGQPLPVRAQAPRAGAGFAHIAPHGAGTAWALASAAGHAIQLAGLLAQALQPQSAATWRL